DTIRQPGDLNGKSLRELNTLAAEIRAELIDIVSQTGGHLGASLGTVELAIALHYVFESPRDKLVWDVGHQAYVHKILTGRRDRFPTLRQENGMSGFLSRDESAHDAFGAGHASTSISAALGMCVAEQRKPKQSRGRAVAIIGDGALTGGMAFEGLNNAGNLNYPFMVVLNDNEMSIAPNVGALSKYLDRMRSDKGYNRAKDELADKIAKLPKGELLVELGKRTKDSFKEFIYHSMIWEELGFTYIGPVDGHDIKATIEALRRGADIEGPSFVHILTKKGKGYEPALTDKERSHAISAPSKPQPVGSPPVAPKYQDVFADTLIELGATNDRVYAITAAMPGGTSLGKFGARFPERFFDVGIAEQHAVTFAAGLASEGLRPVCGIYSTFLQRAYDQIIHDVCIQKLPVIFGMDRAGFAGDDGRTHHGVFDLSYLRCLPNMTIMAPKDENELRHMLATAVDHTEGPTAVRFPRGAGIGVDMSEPLKSLPFGKAEVLRDGKDVAILAVGSMVANAELAADELANDGITATVVNVRFVKPFDEELVRALAISHGAIVTIEESAAAGGFGSGVLEFLSAEGLSVPTKILGVPDHFFEQASQNRLRELAGLGVKDIVNASQQVLAARRLAGSRKDAPVVAS
ncbi:MAG TPA: 1-deoxy-D-xylulose-5-phosphate synthase, partial [Thermomicrobiales bacterium]|nr:1-deoxy-D-xylulose-5-phosphate synthase [Thermomicrobiales bacterium]